MANNVKYSPAELDWIDANADILDTNQPWDLVWEAYRAFKEDRVSDIDPRSVYLFMINELDFDDIADIWQVPINEQKWHKERSDEDDPPKDVESFAYYWVNNCNEYCADWELIPAIKVITDNLDDNGLLLWFFLFFDDIYSRPLEDFEYSLEQADEALTRINVYGQW